MGHLDLCLDITVAGSPSPVASEDEEESASNAASNHSGNHRSNHGSARKGRQKRGVLPKQATSIMRTWLFQHLVVSSLSINLRKTLDRNLTRVCCSIPIRPKMRNVRLPARQI